MLHFPSNNQFRGEKKEKRNKKKKRRKKILRSKVWEHVKSNSLWFTGILSDNRSNGNVLWTTGPTRDYWRKQNGQLYSIKGKSCLKAGQAVAICGETKVEVTEEILFEVFSFLVLLILEKQMKIELFELVII